MYLQIKKILPVAGQYGNDLKITMVGVYDDDEKWVKWAKLNGDLLEKLKNAKIKI
jgi:hypothetical protein